MTEDTPSFLKSTRRQTDHHSILPFLIQSENTIRELHQKATSRDLSLDVESRLICVATMLAVLHDTINQALRRRHI
jgi:hypothetical protein